MATNLTDIIKKVRTALRGEEVRGSIADGLEYCGQISENAKADMEASAAATKEQLSKDIDAKAAAALKSIPESYTELDGSVKQLNEDLTNLENTLKLPKDTYVLEPSNIQNNVNINTDGTISNIENTVLYKYDVTNIDTVYICHRGIPGKPAYLLKKMTVLYHILHIIMKRGAVKLIQAMQIHCILI